MTAGQLVGQAQAAEASCGSAFCGLVSSKLCCRAGHLAVQLHTAVSAQPQAPLSQCITLCAMEHWRLPGKQGPLEALFGALSWLWLPVIIIQDTSSCCEPLRLAAMVTAAVPHSRPSACHSSALCERRMLCPAGVQSLGIREAGHRSVARLTPQRQQPAPAAVPWCWR